MKQDMSHPIKGEKESSASTLSRRAFVGLLVSGLGTLAGWLAACRRAVAPTPEPSLPTGTPTTTSTPTSTTTLPPTDTPLPQAPKSPASTSPVTPPPSPASSPSPTYTAIPATSTLPPSPTATPTSIPNRAKLAAHWPTVETSRVVLVRHSDVWAGDEPNQVVVRQMLDAGLATLTGIADALAAWRILFDPGERVLLKVNCIAYGGPTQPAVTYAVAQRLQEAGLAAENILIFDRTDHELTAAGYSLNKGDPGLQCHGARGKGSEAALSQARVRFFQELDRYDTIVNLPTPKQHSGAGISVSLKNHYGSVDNPGALHGNWCDPAIAELNAQPNIRDKTRLIVGAALNVSPCDWNRPERENALLLAFDPVALDTVARDILIRHRQAMNLDIRYLVEGSRHLRTAQSLELGATQADFIDLREVVLA